MDGIERDKALLRDMAEYYNLTPAALARRAGVAVTTVNRPFSGTSTHRISQPTLDKLRNAFPDYPSWPDYLATGVADRQLAYRGPEAEDPDLVEIEQIDLRYGMGGTYTEGHVEVAKRQFSREWLRAFTPASPANLTWALGDGDSMEPTIRSGEVILIDRSQDTPRLSDGIWACALGEIGMIKRLRYLPDGNVELHSDNQFVPPQLAADGELHVVGRVIAVVRRL